MGRRKQNRFFKFLVTIVTVIFAGTVPQSAVYGQTPVASGDVTRAPVAEEEIEPSLPKPGNVTVNFKNVDINTVFRYLSEVSGVDIIPSPGVEGKVTMRLRDKPWEVALDIVTRNYGYAYSREADIIRVIPKGVLQTEEPITAVIPLNYIIESAEDEGQNITQLLEAVTSVIVEEAGEKATFLPSANAIVVTAIPARIASIRDMIDMVDKKTPQIMLEAKVIEITLDRNDQFGVDWNAVITAAGARRPTTLPFDRSGVIPLLPKNQRWYYPYGTDVAGTARNEKESEFPYIGFSTLVDHTAAATSGAIFTYGTLDFTSFQAVLRLIDEWDNTDIISSPRITTLNNQPAIIKVIQNVYLQRQQTSTDTAAVVTVEFEEEPREIGVILEVTPHVNDREEITIDLKPQVSSTLAFTELSVSNSQNTVAMTFNSREADTQVMVRDGETIFIGGLIKKTRTKEDHKFPILGDIFGMVPVVGNLFKYEQDNIDKTEVVFFVTVHLLRDARDSIKGSQPIDEYYEEYYTEEEKKAAEEASKQEREPVIKTGELKETERTVEVPIVPLKAEKREKEYKPFLDFRKKK